MRVAWPGSIDPGFKDSCSRGHTPITKRLSKMQVWTRHSREGVAWPGSIDPGFKGSCSRRYTRITKRLSKMQVWTRHSASAGLLAMTVFPAMRTFSTSTCAGVTGRLGGDVRAKMTGGREVNGVAETAPRTVSNDQKNRRTIKPGGFLFARIAF